MFKDVKRAVDDDYYFIFEDFLHQLLLVFSRDPEVADLAYRSKGLKVPKFMQFPDTKTSQSTRNKPDQTNKNINSPSPSSSSSSEKETEELPYPPNGVIPFRGFSLLLAPLCYIFNSPELLYVVFKKIYCTYWVKLHTLRTNYNSNTTIVYSNANTNSNSQSDNATYKNISFRPSFELQNPASIYHNHGITSLCINIEQRLLIKTPALIQHLSRLGISITEIVFPWLFSAFAKFLPPDQVLILWDFVIQRDSLFPLADLSVGIILFRERSLFSCEERHVCEAALKDLSVIDVELIFFKFFGDT